MTTLIDHFPTAGCYAPQPLLKSSGHGEGSRGGKIIGHTKSGKPIYALSHDHYQIGHSRSSHPNEYVWPLDHLTSPSRAGSILQERLPDYNQQDHKDAAKLHLNKLDEWGGKHRQLMRDAQVAAFGHKLNSSHRALDDVTSRGTHPDYFMDDNDAIREAYSSIKGHDAAASAHLAAASKIGLKKSFRGYISKATKKGEGSRGGKIIGHTRSGKPIYHHSAPQYQRARDIGRPSARTADGMRQATIESGAHYAKKFPSYSFEDHEDAFDLHGKNPRDYKDFEDHGEATQASLAHHDVMFRKLSTGWRPKK